MAVDEAIVWEFPVEQYGSMNAQNEFTEDESVELEVLPGEEATAGIELPLSMVKSGHFYIKR
ncbi:MAG: hypothetical protein R6U17_03310, partial [Thermoplasmata archaeon]